ncbi:hypothetical protein GCM10010172_35310 [Paractinoplanes ferrugineus]|uniref:Uncharacterized protein n=1 Tax=Paractinoplanes ferrugineus TaxID=113564 RepID=A0A919MJ62_9ACTN|nr:hypothetical protein [Actinoplanes ferrugineus]GIE16759.1 hypothetical protein Afe05nite_85990 [Actinoplanes ferrugineus]
MTRWQVVQLYRGAVRVCSSHRWWFIAYAHASVRQSFSSQGGFDYRRDPKGAGRA